MSRSSSWQAREQTLATFCRREVIMHLPNKIVGPSKTCKRLFLKPERKRILLSIRTWDN